MGKGCDAISLSVSAAVLSQLARYSSSLGIDVAGLLSSVGADPAILASPDEQIAIETYIAIENEAARVSGDPCFGLHMGEAAEPGNYSILGYVMMNSETLGEAVAKAARYNRIVGNLLTPVYQPGLGKVKIVMTAPRHAPRFSRHCFEAAFSTQIVLMRKLTGRNISPLEVGFSRSAPESMSEYVRVFGCPVLFDRKNDYIVVGTGLGRIPILQPNAQLRELFEGHARSELERIDGDKATAAAATRIILDRLPRGRVTAGGVARELSMSVRTLQGRLSEEGEVFSRLLEDIRISLAKRYLGDAYSVEEITMLLGFSEPSAFRRAFKKAAGMTPREYRETAYPRSRSAG